MPLAHYVKDKERKWMFKVIEQQSPWPERDACLMTFFLATPCTIYELNNIKLMDVYSFGSRQPKKFKLLKKDYKGNERFCYLTNKDLRKSIDRYVGTLSEYIGAMSELFVTCKGEPFSLTKTPKGYKADSLKRHIFDLMKEAGIENPGMDSGRRTFAVNLHRAGIDMSHIHHLLGNKAKKTTQRQLTSDPINMADIAARAF